MPTRPCTRQLLAATTAISQQASLTPRQVSFGSFRSSTGSAWHLNKKSVGERNREDLSRASSFSRQAPTVFGCKRSTPRLRRCDRRHRECGKSRCCRRRHPRREDGLLKKFKQTTRLPRRRSGAQPYLKFISPVVTPPALGFTRNADQDCRLCPRASARCLQCRRAAPHLIPTSAMQPRSNSSPR